MNAWTGLWTTPIVLAIGLLTWHGVRHFVRQYRAQGVPVMPWYARVAHHRGSIPVDLALVWATLVGLHAYLTVEAVSPVVWATLMGTTAWLLAISLIDLAVHRIPNPLIGGLLAWGFAQPLWLPGFHPFSALVGLALGGGTFFLIALAGRGALGMGDVKLAAALGAVVGYPHIIPALVVGILSGGFAALILLLTRHISRKDYLAYGPYLALGAWVVLIRLLV